jgi:hypothetical protein
MLRNGFHTSLAETIVDDIQFLRNNYYYFIGKTYPWGDTDTPPSSEPNLSYINDYQIQTDSLYYKKIQPSDVSLAVNRNVWTSGTVYSKWDHTIDMSNMVYYVVVYDSSSQKYNVYKCLDNNSNAISTQTPTGTGTSPITYSDGYIWKFMYSITSAMMTAFGNATKMPVFVSMTKHFYDKGPIASISILDGGSGYSSDTMISIDGDGSGAVAVPTITNGVITGIQFNNHGSGYTYANITLISTTTPTRQAVVRAIIDASAYTTEQSVVEQTTIDGAIYCVNIVNGGTFYSSQTTITISGDGSGAVAVPTITNGIITKITMSNVGSGYSYAIVTINDPVVRQSGSVDFSGYAIMSPVGGHGKNAVAELKTSEVLFSAYIPLMSFQNANDFRQFGIVKNPTYIASGKTANSTTELIAYKVVLDNINNLTLSTATDAILSSNSVTDTTSKYRLVYVNQATKEVILKTLSKNCKTPNTLTWNGNTYTVQTINFSPSIDKYSGNLLYVSNSVPFATVPAQNITLKTILKF